jgi:hypothetical protein
MVRLKRDRLFQIRQGSVGIVPQKADEGALVPALGILGALSMALSKASSAASKS